MNGLMIIVFCLATFAVNSVIATRCNGIEGLCQLKFNEVTFAGTHNSGAERVMKYNAGIFMLPAPSCSYRNQDKGFLDQLGLGIRFFDIDTRSKNGDTAYCSHNTAFGRKLKHAIRDIADFLNRASSRNEVVAIRFHDTTMSRSKFGQIEKHFKAYFFQSGKVHANDQAEWPTLQQAVDANKRVFIFMTDKLCDASCRSTRPYIRASSLYGDTWQKRYVTSSCSGIVGDTRRKCEAMTRPLSLVSAFGSEGLCVSDMQRKCDEWTRASAMACFDERKKSGKTVNFLTVDYFNRASYNKKVTTIADELNVLNLEMRGY